MCIHVLHLLSETSCFLSYFSSVGHGAGALEMLEMEEDGWSTLWEKGQDIKKARDENVRVLINNFMLCYTYNIWIHM